MTNVLVVMPISTLDFGSRSSGGVDSVCQILLDSLVQSNQVRFNYTIIAFNPFNDLTQEGKCTSFSKHLTIYQYNSKPKSAKNKVPLPGILHQNIIIWKFVRKFKPQILHTHLLSWQILPNISTANIATLHAYKKYGRSSVSMLNDLLYEKIIPYVANKNINLYTAVSKKLQIAASNTKKSIEVIYNPLPEKYSNIDIVEAQTPRLDHINLVTCSNITKNKGIHHAINVLHELSRKKVGCHLHVIGGLTNSNYQRQIFKQVKEYGLETNITFHGKLTTTEILNIYKISNYGLFLSAEETFGLVPLEMISCGLQTICTRVGIMDDLYKEFRQLDIYILDSINPSEIANYILTQNNSKLIDAKQFIIDKFAKEKIIQQYEVLYESAVSAK